MQHISQLTNNPQPQNTQTNLTQPYHSILSNENEPSDQLIMAIGQLFAQWKLWFKNKMKPSEWETDTVLIWANYLTAKNITKHEFGLAKSLSIDLDFAPNNAKEFLALARNPIEQNYPEMRQAYLEAANGKYVNAVTYETAKRIGFWDIKTKSESQTYPRWQQTYPKVCQEHAQGATFTLPKTHRLTDNSHKPIDWSSHSGKEIERRLQAFKRPSATQAPTKRATA